MRRQIQFFFRLLICCFVLSPIFLSAQGKWNNLYSKSNWESLKLNGEVKRTVETEYHPDLGKIVTITKFNRKGQIFHYLRTDQFGFLEFRDWYNRKHKLKKSIFRSESQSFESRTIGSKHKLYYGKNGLIRKGEIFALKKRKKESEYIYEYSSEGKILFIKDYIEDSLSYRTEIIYNEQDLIIQVIGTDADGLKEEEYVYEYNTKGDLLLEIHSSFHENGVTLKKEYRVHYNENGTLSQMISFDLEKKEKITRLYTYKYDEKGNWIEKIEQKGKDVIITERTVEYF